jgi:hypothetical protein
VAELVVTSLVTLNQNDVEERMAFEIMGGCCAQPKGLTKITFLDGTQISVIGLEEILTAACAEGKPANLETAKEMLKKVEAKNYVASCSREEYPDLLLKEYRKYLERREGEKR